MNLRILFFAFLITSSFQLCAQSLEYTGKIYDSTAKEPVKNAVVALMNPSDSMFMNFTRSREDGTFSLKGMKPGKYIFMVTHPTFGDFVDDINISETVHTSGTVSVTPKMKLLEAVILNSTSPIRIKGDTTIYTADSFKVSANANVEELLKKLPGIQVDKDGKIKAMGETVEKVLVDGEEFFGDDPGMAVKNLRADAVKEVQVFNKKSDQSEFTGIDDGQTKKTINLKLKEDKKKGYFGKISLSGGLNENQGNRYNNNLLLSSFKGKRKISGFYLGGNTGQDGLSWEDNEKFGGNDNMSMSMDEDGGAMMMWRSGSADDEPYVNTQNGFIKNDNAGVQFTNKYNDKHTINFSPKYNNQVYNNRQQYFRQTRIGDSLLNENSNTLSSVNRYNLKNGFIYEDKIDSNNSLKVTLRANFYHTENNEYRTSETTGETGTAKNSSDRMTDARYDKTALTASAIFKHKFKKLRRTLSFNANWNMLQTDGDNINNSLNQTYFDGLPATMQQLKQQKLTDKKLGTFSGKFVYTEPLSEKYSLELAGEVSRTHGNNDQVTYSYSPFTNKYDQAVDSLTNDFVQDITVYQPSAKLNYSVKKLKINVGSGFGITNYNFKDLTYNKTYVRNYTNIFPQANFIYTYKSNHSVRINYNGNTTQPTLNQLQPLRDNNDYFNQYIGNPGLKPSFSNSFNLSHNSYNFIKDRWMYQSLNVRMVSNAITNSRAINVDSGKTITRPVNTDGNYNISFWSGGGFKWKKPDIRVNINPNFNFYRSADIINNAVSFSKTLSAGVGLNLSKSKDKKYELSLRNNVSYNRNLNRQSLTAIHYVTNEFNAEADVYLTKTFILSSDYAYNFRQKTPQFNSSLNTHIWNAGVKKTFKKNEFTAFFKIRDILNQNVGIQRSFYGNSLVEERNDRLKRYWLVGFTWDFKNKTATTK
ncbi:MAG: outer membrane beta-barrel protein [Ferruginibacter sp.]